MSKPGIQVDVPGFGKLDIHHMVTDYTGTLSCDGKLSDGVRERLLELAKLVDIHVLTSDTFGTAAKQLEGIDLTLQILQADDHDQQKEVYVNDLGAAQAASFGNGTNDRLMLKAVKQAGGLAVAVDTGEGCAVDALMAAQVFANGALNALALLMNDKRCKAALRF